MKRAGRALVGAVALLAVGGASGLAYLTTPIGRARYHLRLVSADDVKFGQRQSESFVELTGHAKAFVESSAARDLLESDLLPRVREEADDDAATTYRGLLLAAREKLWPTVERHFYVGSIDSRYLDWPRDVPAEVLEPLVRALGSRHDALRFATLERLPRDPRALEAVLGHFARHASHQQSADASGAFRWLVDFAHEQPDVLREGEGEADPWVFLTHHGDRHAETCDLPALARDLRAWLEAHRALLPPQLEVRP